MARARMVRSAVQNAVYVLSMRKDSLPTGAALARLRRNATRPDM